MKQFIFIFSLLFFAYACSEQVYRTIKVQSQVEGEVEANVDGNIELHPEHSDIILKAVPYDGYNFVGWYDINTLISTENPYNFKVIKDVNLTAKYAEKMDLNKVVLKVKIDENEIISDNYKIFEYEYITKRYDYDTPPNGMTKSYEKLYEFKNNGIKVLKTTSVKKDTMLNLRVRSIQHIDKIKFKILKDGANLKNTYIGEKQL